MSMQFCSISHMCTFSDFEPIWGPDKAKLEKVWMARAIRRDSSSFAALLV